MSLFTTFLSLALVGGAPDGPKPQPTPASAPMRFEIRLLQMKGLDWRAAVHKQLTPGDSRSSPGVWTAPRAVLTDLEKACETTLYAPAVSAEPDAPVSVTAVNVRNMVADVRRVADAPEGQNTCVAIVPVLGEVREGFEAKLSGRPVPSGTLTRVDLCDTRFVALHTVTIPETFVDEKTKEIRNLNAQIQVPEVVKGGTRGEWMIPSEGVLVVSLGAYSTTDAKGKSTTYERLAVIEPYCAKAESKVTKTALSVESCDDHQCVEAGQVMPVSPSLVMALASPTVGPQPAWRASMSMTASAGVTAGSTQGKVTLFGVSLPIASPPFMNFDVKVAPRADTVDKPMPALPSRGLPTAIAADGTVVPLPRLPDEDLVMTSADDDSEPRPAPQALPHGKPAASPSAPVAEGVSSLARVTRFEARGNTLIVRDSQDGRSKLVCDELVVFPIASATNDEPACCAHDAGASGLAEVQPGAVVPFRAPAPQADAAAMPVHYRQDPFDPTDTEDFTTLGFQLNSSLRGCEYDSTVSVKNLNREPITLRIPMADGSIVEVTAKLVKKAAK